MCKYTNQLSFISAHKKEAALIYGGKEYEEDKDIVRGDFIAKYNERKNAWVFPSGKLEVSKARAISLAKKYSKIIESNGGIQ